MSEALEYRVGYDKEHMLRLKYAGGEPASKLVPVAGTLEQWQKVAILHGHGGSLRLFVLEPSTETNELVWGDFYIKGRFSITQRVNNNKKAQQAWETFGAQ
jgi:hypothetical protein